MEILIDEDTPIKESFEPKPFNVYGKTKLEQTRIGLDWKNNEKFIVFARPFNYWSRNLSLLQ